METLWGGTPQSLGMLAAASFPSFCLLQGVAETARRARKGVVSEVTRPKRNGSISLAGPVLQQIRTFSGYRGNIPCHKLILSD